ncbi:MAG: SRPBCC family protein [Proteobacteria bacterium]|nr:SRPBCC family protein [Pseudomonadota bacterium]
MACRYPLQTLFAFWLISAGQGSVFAQEVSIETTRQGDFFLVDASVDLQSDVRIVWQVLSDYDRLAQFIPDMKSSRVVERNAEGPVVEQLGEYSFLFFSQPIEVRLQVVETPPHRIVSRAVAGSFREMTGSYDLSPISGGVRLRYAGRMNPKFDVPPFFGTVAVRAVAEKQFRGMVDEILRRSMKAP